jgi:hypothetical protein
LYSRQDSNLHPLRSRRSIQPIGMLLYVGGIATTFSCLGLMVIHFGKASAFRRNAYSLLSAPNALLIGLGIQQDDECFQSSQPGSRYPLFYC